MRALVIGNFGRQRPVCGQTAKTRDVAAALRELMKGHIVDELDLDSSLRRPVNFLWRLLRGVREVDEVVFLPGYRSLQALMPLVFLLGKLFRTPVRYVVIGGWLPELLQERLVLRWVCRRLSGVYPETVGMALALQRIGFRNVEVVPNIRFADYPACRVERVARPPFRLVYYSRVLPEKGFEDAVRAVAELNRRTRPGRFILDVFGPVPDHYLSTFEAVLEGRPDVRYRGVLGGSEAHSTLSGYDAMLFPTRYLGEGFPGAVLHAFMVGLPVVATRWRYNAEVVVDGVTGALVDCGDVLGLAEAARRVVEAADVDYVQMRRACRAASDSYDYRIALRPLVRDVAIGERRAGFGRGDRQ